MALVKFGGGVTEFRGALAGNIFSRNKAGAYVKKYTVPTNPQTERQMEVRGQFSAVSVLWASLTELQRDAWASAATGIPFTNSVGDIYFLSGFGLFCKSNNVMVEIDEDPLQDCPDKFDVPDTPVVDEISSSKAVPDILISSPMAVIPAERTYILDGAPQSGVGVTNNNSLFKRITNQPSPNPWDTANMYAHYSAVFGDIQEGQRIEFRFAAVDHTNGFVSPYGKAFTIVAA